MQCSAAEIERKRQEALQKLAKKNSSPAKAQYKFNQAKTPNQVALSSSTFKSRGSNHFTPYEKASSSSYQSRKTAVNFYGASSPVTVTISLLTSDKICIKVSGFCPPVFDCFKTIPSRNYDPQTKIWSFHMNDYEAILNKLIGLKSQNVVVEQLPKFVLKCFRSHDVSCEIDPNRLDPVLLQTLLPFQFEGLQFGVGRKGRCLIADDMGLGKTFQALAIMNYYKEDWPLLIVTTATMKNVWEGTILKYMPSISIMQIQYMVSGKDYIGNSSILIVSHDLMSRTCDKLLERNFGCVIIDESHNVKNHKTKVTQSAIKLCKKARRVVLLSGTPALSRPNELFSQLSLIDESFFGNFFEYAKRYCDLQQTQFGWDSSGKSNLHELELILKKRFMIRRRKEDVLGSLPNKTQEVIKLNVNLRDLKNEDKMMLEMLSSQFLNTTKSHEKHAILLSWFCETAKIKIPAVCSHILSVLSSGIKFLVFAHHLIMLDALEAVLKQKNCKYIRIDGSSTGDQRKYFVDKFQTDETCICALLSITAANAGITLTAAQQVVFAELHWNPSILNQAEARVHRIGQEKPVLIQYLLAEDTADYQIWPLLQKKQNILSEMGLNKENFSDINEKEQICQKNTMLNYFSPNPTNLSTEEDDSMLDDGLDDILCNIDI